MGKLSAFCLHSSALSAFVCMGFGVKSLILLMSNGLKILATLVISVTYL
jgi:hypothetical protein